MNRADQVMMGIGEKRMRIQYDDGSVDFKSRFVAPDTSIDLSFHTALEGPFDAHKGQKQHQPNMSYMHSDNAAEINMLDTEQASGHKEAQMQK